MSQIVDIEAQADLFGTYRVTVFYRSEDGHEAQPLVLKGVSEWAVTQAILALGQDSPTTRRDLAVLMQDTRYDEDPFPG